MTLTWEGGRAALASRGPSIVRRVRLASGLVLFTYVFLHFLNHSLGNISWQEMEWGGVIHEWIWRNPVGTVALYGAFAAHLSLAFWAIYIRRHLRMGWIEALRLGLGSLRLGVGSLLLGVGSLLLGLGSLLLGVGSLLLGFGSLLPGFGSLLPGFGSLLRGFGSLL